MSSLIVIAFQLCSAKLQPQQNKTSVTVRSLNVPTKKQNVTITAKSAISKAPIQAKRTNIKHHEGNKTLKNESVNAVSRQMNIENFVDSHKGAIVRLLKKLLLPKLKARALQAQSVNVPLETDPSNKNLDKEAMNYELGYFLGLQKAFKNRQMLMGDSGEQSLVPLKLVHHAGSKAAVSDSGPMTGFTSVALPFHKLKTPSKHESLEAAFTRYGMQDPGFLKKITRADERDILQFAGKHNMDVFAENNNLKGISDYLAKRSFINRPVKVAETNEGTSQRIKKGDIAGPEVFADEPDRPKGEEALARVESGPNPLENVPTPLHKIVSQADHISSKELNGLLTEYGNEKINMKEIYGLIDAEEKAKERLEDEDKTPQVGSVYGEDTQVQAENGFRDMEKQQDITTEELENVDKRPSDSEIEKRTLKGLMKLIEQNEYEEERNELRQVLRRIISKLSEIPNHNEKRNYMYEIPYHQRRGLTSRNYIPYYYAPVYTGIRTPTQRLWRRNDIPRPKLYTVQRRAKLPHTYDVTSEAFKPSDSMNDYEFESENHTPPDLEETGGVEAYALPKVQDNPGTRIEKFMSTPVEESLHEALALLNRGSSIDDSLGDHLQAGFLQKYLSPNAPSALYKRNVLKRIKVPHNLRFKLRARRSNDVKGKVTVLRRKKVAAKSKKHHGKKRTHDLEGNTKPAAGKETTAEITSKGSKKHEILRDPTVSVLSGLDSYVSPAVFESRSQNFFTQGSHDNSRFINQMGSGTVLLSGPKSGIGTAMSKTKLRNHYGRLQRNGGYQHKSKYLEQFISNPRMSGFRSPSYAKGQSRSTFVGNRQISPVLDIYKDNSVSSNGDLPVMEVQNMRPSGMIQDQAGAEQLAQEMPVPAQEVPQMRQEVQQGGNFDAQNGLETQGQGSIEMSSKYEVVKSPGMQDGNMQLMNDDLLAQQNSQVMEEPKGDEHTGANAIAVEEISGEAKQAISNTLAALDKQSVDGTKSELESCCQADPKSSCCLLGGQRSLEGEMNFHS